MYNVLDATYEAKILEGERRNAEAVAKRMLEDDTPLEKVIKFTNLTRDEVRKIQAEITRKTQAGS